MEPIQKKILVPQFFIWRFTKKMGCFDKTALHSYNTYVNADNQDFNNSESLFVAVFLYSGNKKLAHL